MGVENWPVGADGQPEKAVLLDCEADFAAFGGITLSKLEEIAQEIEQSLQNDMEREVSSAVIGEMVMQKLKEVDEVAYVRFASVYRQFKDIGTFMDELNKLLDGK